MSESAHASKLDTQCEPCHEATTPLSRREAAEKMKDLPGWELSEDGGSIARLYHMGNFLDGVKRIQEIATLAEKAGHHPDVHLTRYRNLLVELTTHHVGGLTENDFYLASQIEKL